MRKLLKIFKKFHFQSCFVILNILIIILELSQGIQWLALGKEPLQWQAKSRAAQCKVARRSRGLMRQQTRICRTTFEAMPFITRAAEQTLETCQNLFERRRWNCSTILTAPDFTRDLTTGTREQAFVYALSSASVAYEMSKGCASGGLFNCSCSGHPKEPPNGNFKWGGCGDNIRWGLKFGKHFTDAGERKASGQQERRGGRGKVLSRSMEAVMESIGDSTRGKTKSQLATVNLQNNRAGRKAVEMSLKTQCKCHGVSGSCSIKICWKALPRFMEIGERLQKKYGTSVEVSQLLDLVEHSTIIRRLRVDDKTLVVVPRKFGYGKKLVPAGSSQYFYNSDDLVYMTKSPDYCLRDDKTGSLGTRGRSCNRTSVEHDSCEIMCCGRGHVTLTVQKVEMCRCKFHWCCTVACKKCLHWVDTHICN